MDKILITLFLVCCSSFLWAAPMEKCVTKGERTINQETLLGVLPVEFCRVYCPSIGEIEVLGKCAKTWLCVGSQYDRGYSTFGASAYKHFQGKCPTKKQVDKYVAEKKKREQTEKEKKEKEKKAEKERAEAEKRKKAQKLYEKLCSVKGNGVRGTMTDSRDGTEYETVQICSQVWMAENLYYKTEGSACLDNKESKCAKYGRYYIWYSAQSACPDGWRLPTKQDLDILMWVASYDVVLDSSEKYNDFAKKLKATLKLMTTDFYAGFDNHGLEVYGSDAYGFSAIPTGDATYPTREAAENRLPERLRLCQKSYELGMPVDDPVCTSKEVNIEDFIVFNTGMETKFWTSTKADDQFVFVMRFPFFKEGYYREQFTVHNGWGGGTLIANPIRCIKDDK